MRPSWLGSFFTYTAWHSWPRSASRFMSVIEWRSAPPCTRDPVTKSGRMSGPVAEVAQRDHRLAPGARAELGQGIDRDEARAAEREPRERRGARKPAVDHHPGESGGKRGAADAAAEGAPVLQLAHRDAG